MSELCHWCWVKLPAKASEHGIFCLYYRKPNLSSDVVRVWKEDGVAHAELLPASLSRCPNCQQPWSRHPPGFCPCREGVAYGHDDWDNQSMDSWF